MIEYDPHLVEQVAHILDLRVPNQAALDALAKALDHAHDGVELVADLATGVGKTYIAAGLLDYLWESGVRDVVIVTPGSTIQKKTINNLTPGHPKYVRGLRSNPTVITLDTFERGESATALEDPDRFKVFVFTVQSLLRPTSNEGRRAHRPHETVGQALSTYLASAQDLIVIADEHHVYFSGSATKFHQAIADLRPAALVGLTATPHEASADKIVYHYPLSDAIADGYVKIPVLVTREDGKKDWHTQLGDGINLLNVKAAAMGSYATQTKQTYVEPVLFVVATNIDEANQFRDALAGKDMLDGEYKVLLVTSEEPDKTLALLDTLEDPASPIRAVVSVDMLKEGWDVKNIYVIAAPSRALSSGLLTEQILGRGLRLPFGKRTGNPMLDTVEVLSHNSFAALMKDAQVLLSQTLANRATGSTMVVNPTPGIHQSGVPTSTATTGAVDPATTKMVEFRVAPANPNQGTLLDDQDDRDWVDSWGTGEVDPTRQEQVGLQIATIESRLGNEEAVQTHTYKARAVGGVKVPLWLPRVTIRWDRDPFSMVQLDLGAVESLGWQFAEDHGPSLTRKAVDAHRTATGVVLDIHDLDEDVAASTELMDFSNIENDLVQRLMLTNAITQSVAEANATLAVARAFLAGAGVTEETPWREEHGRLATNRLAEWINSKRTSSPLREVREVHQVKWPEPPERVEARPPTSRHLITSSQQFERLYPYSGWTRSVYEVNTFDAYSTEFKLANLFESAKVIASWARIDNTVPLRINYLIGAAQREYMPDFLVVDAAAVYWIVEGKADDAMMDPKVLAKRDAAIAWVKTVNESDDVHQKWGYILASETTIKNSPSWEALKAGAQTYQ